jgi:gas vesicle protein
VNNLAIIVGCSVGAVVVAVIALLVMLKVKKNSKKTVVNASAEQIKQYIV